ncbi:helix-turn-helix transcriptional regulator [Sphingosinicella sp. BN140058]|uniref:helix-turn-helix transcriptional regulator n=1 Tax=Sphingosinicella sp. BN140058 TaxID=1892855 RepID=UPI001011A939|nr:helix-turn-helix transcriptional regulator [Sphingosinicella sp. BN140058]QAY79049.1 LuxR family transcriptional regulator [Sphingosinicella sp. BN140058]
MNDPTLLLSEGQKNCLRLVAKGMSSKEIAKETGLTPQTVDTYVKASISRLGAANRREAARALVAWEQGGAGEPVPAVEAELVSNAGEQSSAESWSRWLGLPPLGGRENNLSWTQKTVQALQVAIVAAATLIAIALAMAGMLKTFS